MLDIKITKTTSPKAKPTGKLGFGKIFTDHMFLMNYTRGKGWHDPRIEPFHDLTLSPACMVFHYGQEMFEGLKAYKAADGSNYLFRPDMNAKRTNNTNDRLCIPQIPVEDFVQAVKALFNEYYDQGLRMIEIYKHQFRDLSAVIAMVKNRNYRFIIFIDDLSFEENEVEYKFLKAVIEGGVETKPDNILLYATSNRRNLIRETWKDRADMEHDNDVHHSDTLEEKLSLSARFGVRINYSIPNRNQFKDIVLTLAKRQGLTLPEEVILAEANKWELRHGGVSGRTAQQFINYLAGTQTETDE